MWKRLFVSTLSLMLMIICGGPAMGQASPPECSWEHGGVTEVVPTVCNVPSTVTSTVTNSVSVTVTNTPLPVSADITATVADEVTATVTNLDDYHDEWLFALGVLIFLAGVRVVGEWGRDAR
jgi:hypothetical protein